MWNHIGRRAAVVAIGLGVAALGLPGTAHAEGTVLYANSPQAVQGSYVVTLKSGAAHDIARRHGGSVSHVYDTALRGFAMRATAGQARRLAADTRVASVEQDQYVQATGTQLNPPSWGLDRIDQRFLPLNNTYNYPNIGAGQKVYIIDTGIRYTHVEFGGRAVLGVDIVGGTGGNDCHGHGTHVAGTVGGRSYGVAKGVRLVSVRVLDCAGSGTIAGVIAGVNWVTGNAAGRHTANMSLGGALSGALNNAVNASANAGTVYAVAAGNSNANACGFSPASANALPVLTVGATTITDNRAPFSNWGPCLDLFAPGANIKSAWATNDNASAVLNGTSMAAPHVAGSSALFRFRFPAATAGQVRNALFGNATNGVVINPGAGSPNKLLYMGFIPV